MWFGLFLVGTAAAFLSVWTALYPAKRITPPEIPRTDLVFRDGGLYQLNHSSPFTGVMVEFYPDGSLKSRSAISNGLLEGVSEGWHTNGQRQVREEFRRGISHGRRAKWYADGARQSEACIENGELHGTFRRWHQNGKLWEEIQMRNGSPDGISWAFYSSGFLKARTRMARGKVVEQRFWPDGEARRDGAQHDIPADIAVRSD